MPLLNVPIERIDQGFLQELIDAKTMESRFIDYKRETYSGKDADKAEFLADVSSFANAAGGDLLIGMDSVAGVATELTPFVGNADAELLRLEQIARTGLEPRIPQLQLRAVPVEGGGAVLVIRAPRSYRQPHRVSFQGKNRFWTRSSAGKYEPSVDELRAVFILAPLLADRMRQFRLDRIAKIASGETPVKLLDTRCLILLIVPFTHFELGPTVSLQQVHRDTEYFPPFGASRRRDWRINLDGFVTLSDVGEQAAGQRSYVQIFRSGAIEAVASSLARENQLVSLQDIEEPIVRHTHLYVTALHSCGIDPPLVIMASLVGLTGLRLTTGIRTITGLKEGQTVDRDQLHPTEVILEQTPISLSELAVTLRPILDQLANAAGCISSQSFDEAGNYLLGTEPSNL
jgi:hypothetical protein